MRKKKKQCPRGRRRLRCVPTRNKLPPADSFNLKARSLAAWPFSASTFFGGTRFFSSGRAEARPSAIHPKLRDVFVVGLAGSSSTRFGMREGVRPPPPGDAKLLRLRCLILTSSRDCSIHLNALSFRDQAAKIALWKFPASKFHSRN